jgi:hypothetical protein
MRHDETGQWIDSELAAAELLTYADSLELAVMERIDTLPVHVAASSLAGVYYLRLAYMPPNSDSVRCELARWNSKNR